MARGSALNLISVSITYMVYFFLKSHAYFSSFVVCLSISFDKSLLKLRSSEINVLKFDMVSEVPA